MTVGSVVKSRAGRDKGELLVVVTSQDPYVELADGRTRRLEKPKRKKIKHVEPVGFAGITRQGGRLITESGKDLTNKELRALLSCFAASEKEG